MNAIHTLLRQSIDYAGLFPPASLSMTAAARNYVLYRKADDEWALGRFIVPANRLMELEREAAESPTGRTQLWSISALVGPDLESDLARLREFQQRQPIVPMKVDALELKTEESTSVSDIVRKVPQDLTLYFEVPIHRDPTELLASIGKAGARAKVRTGGVTPEAFPSSANLARFIHACVAVNVPFKATAGLHHAIRGEYRLTYEEQSLAGTMFGYLNVFTGTAWARAGGSESTTRRILEETSAESFQFEDREIRWRDQRLSLEQLALARDSVISFGSCSFTEPITELQALTQNVQA